MTARTPPAQPAAAGLNRIVVGDGTLAETVLTVTTLALVAVDGATEASLTLVDDGRADTVTSGGGLSAQLDHRQHEPGFGPSLDAALEGRTIALETMSATDDYPQFATLVRRHGVTGTLSVGFSLSGPAAAALTFYGTEGLLEAERIAAAESFARDAALVLANALRYHDARALATNLERAMASRAVIEQAKGVVMARTSCTSEEAFEVLTRGSQRHNVKLRDLAQRLVDHASGRRTADPLTLWPGPEAGSRGPRS